MLPRSVRTRSTLLAALAAVALVLAGAPAEAAVAATPDGTVRSAALHGRAEVARDRYGLAHLRAGDRHDLLFLQGWVHAQDRLFQMDVTRRFAGGTLAELLGPDLVPQDVVLRTVGVRRGAEQSLGVLSATTRHDLDAYTEGVNTWVARNGLPPQYAAAGVHSFARWEPVDSVTALKLVAFQVSFFDGLEDLDRTAALQAAVAAGETGGFDGGLLFAEDAYRTQPFTDAATVPDATAAPAPATAALAPATATAAPATAGAATAAGAVPPRWLADAGRLASGWLATARRVAAVDRLSRREGQGSNQWVVSGALARGGRPMLSNDPHLDLGAPSTFYPIHLRGAGFDVIGNGFAGVPYVVIGQNRDIAWGATTNEMDVMDTYLEQVVPDPTAPSGLATVHQGVREPVLAVPEVFRSVDPATGQVTVVPPGDGVPAATLIVPRRNHGPILQLDTASGSAVSVQYTGYSGTRELEAVAGYDRAGNLDEFRAAMQRWDVGSQNWTYADRAGHIGYFTSAEAPVREDLQAGSVYGLPPYFIRDGTGGNEWLAVRNPQPDQAVPYEVLPAAELPHTVDPPAGYVINANNDPAGNTLDNDPINQLRPGGGIYYLDNAYDGLRAGRVRELLQRSLAAGRVDVADMRRIQADVGLIDAEVLAPHLIGAFDRARRATDPALRALGADPAVAEAIGRLRGWDFTTPTGIRRGYDAGDRYGGDGEPGGPGAAERTRSVNATVYAVWRSRLVRDTLDTTLTSLGVPPPSAGDVALADLRTLLENRPVPGVGASGVDFFAVPGVTDHAVARDVVLLRSLARALDALAGPDFAAAFGGSRDQRDYRWGRLHRIVFASPLGPQFSQPREPGPLPPSIPGLPGVSVDGGYGTVDAAYHDLRASTAADFMFDDGPAGRYVGEVGRGGPTGVAALPGAVHDGAQRPERVDLLLTYLVNDYYPLRTD